MTRFCVTIAALAALLGSGPARALDVLEGLAPADFRASGLAEAELRLADGAAPLDPADWIPAASPEAGSRGGTTLTELGIPSVAAEVVESDDALGTALGHASPADLRLLATPGLRESLADALGDDDLGSLGDLLDDAAQGDLGGVLDEVLDGGVLEDVPLDQLPVDELVDVIEDLAPGLLDGAGGLGGLLGRP
jgi:hypothetical protein